eukprot:g41259.t1
MGNLAQPIHLTYTSLDHGRKPEHPEEAHTDTGRMCKFKMNTDSLRQLELNLDPWYCEATLLTTEPPCRPCIWLKKLGVMPPEQPLPQKCYRIYQIMWANNGDAISRQYAGTAALKVTPSSFHFIALQFSDWNGLLGDFTRTGERKLAGMMKDGYNSANRYYLNRFRDAYRQAVIDPMQGIPVTEDLYSIFSKEKEHEALQKQNQRSQQEQFSLLLQNYMKMLLPDDEKFHGGWAVIDCDP